MAKEFEINLIRRIKKSKHGLRMSEIMLDFKQDPEKIIKTLKRLGGEESRAGRWKVFCSAHQSQGEL